MFGGIDPKKMQAMMRQMGIKQEEIPANRVIIEGSDKNIIIENPNVQKIVMQGQESWQITGQAREEPIEEEIKDSDIQLVAEKTGKSEEQARKALEESKGDIAEAIMKLS
jgi:nascent polypeptide-associated complex subunit alpha